MKHWTYKAWTPAEIDVARRMAWEGYESTQIAARLGRTKRSVDYKRCADQWPVAPTPLLPVPTKDRRPAPPPPREELSDKREGASREVRSTSTKIRTVEDLLAHIEADLTKYEVAASEATKWETGDGDGGTIELHRVFVRLRPKSGPNITEAVTALLDGAFAARKPPARPKPAAPAGDVWQVVPIYDVHFGKYAWGRQTGGPDFDLSIAQRVVLDAARDIIAYGDRAHRPARRTIVLGGDLFHYDNPQGATTSGTMLDRDGRLQKMIEVGADTIVSVIEASAATCPTDVELVPGNHDETLTWAFHRVLLERFRLDKRVSIGGGFTSRKYLTWGGNLVGITHGDKATKLLPQIMALEAAREWGAARYREIHKGHLHRISAEAQFVSETTDGVLVWTAPSICPPDGWHAEQGYIGARRAMQSFFYRKAGGLMATYTVDAAA